MYELHHWSTIYYPVFYTHEPIMSELQVSKRSGPQNSFSQHDPDPDNLSLAFSPYSPKTYFNITQAIRISFSVFLVDVFQGVSPTKYCSIPYFLHSSHLPIIFKPFRLYCHETKFSQSQTSRLRITLHVSHASCTWIQIFSSVIRFQALTIQDL